MMEEKTKNKGNGNNKIMKTEFQILKVNNTIPLSKKC
jgi:hypothetical protein